MCNTIAACGAPYRMAGMRKIPGLGPRRAIDGVLSEWLGRESRMRRDFVPPTATAARGVTVSNGWLRITTFIEPAAYGAGPFLRASPNAVGPTRPRWHRRISRLCSDHNACRRKEAESRIKVDGIDFLPLDNGVRWTPRLPEQPEYWAPPWRAPQSRTPRGQGAAPAPQMHRA